MKYYLIFNKDDKAKKGSYINHEVGGSYKNYASMCPNEIHVEVTQEQYENEKSYLVLNESDELVSDETLLAAHKEKLYNIYYRERQTKLTDSDWTQTLDAPITDENKALWATYRSDLRMLRKTISASNIETLVWPTAPEVEYKSEYVIEE